MWSPEVDRLKVDAARDEWHGELLWRVRGQQVGRGVLLSRRGVHRVIDALCTLSLRGIRFELEWQGSRQVLSSGCFRGGRLVLQRRLAACQD
jgi:tRNA G26 N,N-dimethylase Trm1